MVAAASLPDDQGTRGHSAPGSQDPETAPWPRHGEYVGVATCAGCHEIEAELIGLAHHAAVVTSSVTSGCETCHGPGKAHSSDSDGPRNKITHPQKLSPAAQAELCSRCHRTEAVGHGGGGVAGFLRAGLGCTDCHFVHEEIPPPPMAGLRFRSRAATLAAAEPVESERCTSCHPLQADALRGTGHAPLATGGDGCTTCHGNGSRHVVTGGIARLVTRPDRAADGVATCVGCHSDVDPVRAHWSRAGEAFLGEQLECFTCHTVHAQHAGSGSGKSPVAAVATNALCADCHPAAFVHHVPPGSAHESLVRPSRPVAEGCGACHAGSVEHAHAGGRPDLVQSLRHASRTTQERTCLACHAADAALHGLSRGIHARRDVSCTDCHSPSPPKTAARADAESRCATCHPAVAARFRLPNHHPVGESMGCSDCHDPHSARPRLRDVELREERCVECHRAYRGPFVFEHQASRLDGCTACHEPHGSSNRRMLHAANTQQTCIACHGDFPAFHDQSAGSVFTECLSCHTEIHGSDHSRFFFR